MKHVIVGARFIASGKSSNFLFNVNNLPIALFLTGNFHFHIFTKNLKNCEIFEFVISRSGSDEKS